MSFSFSPLRASPLVFESHSLRAYRMRLSLWRAGAVIEFLGWQSLGCRRCVVIEGHISNEATVSGKACRFAPVAIDELNLSELYVARQLVPAS